ncbi:hypothetical protein AAF712_002765 [Marasmius tenuissimus]|uniref:deuterolysin n=1 Tax=Marasmius tenuissimus TaxID=585030 RepID=A0ABR3A989_9AGAR
MLFSAALAGAFATAALANPVKRAADQLTVKVTGPSSGAVESTDDLKFTAEVTNNGAEAVEVLKYGTILDALPTRSFTITQNGTNIPFVGAKLSVALNNDNAYTTIESGKTVTISHEVSSLFDFATAGPGTFSFTPISDFRVAGDQKASHPALMAEVSSSSNVIEVEVKNVVKKEVRRAVTECADSSKKSFIEASYTEGKELASITSQYIGSAGANDQLFTSYFGSNSPSSIASVYNDVAGETGNRLLSCSDPASACDGNVIAYTIISTTDIYYCDIFFDEVPQSQLCGGTTPAARNVRGGTTLHELTHALDNTDDVTYGCSNDKALPDAQKKINADNYNCFATEVFAARC